MQLLKENLFLVVVIAVLLAVGGLVVFGGFTQKSGYEDQLAARQKLISELDRLKSFRVSDEVLGQRSEYISKIISARDDVVNGTVEWNRRNYPVLELKIDDQQTMPAFPYDARQYSRLGLTYTFTANYGKALASLIKQMNPTTQATDEEIQSQIAVQERRLNLQKEIATRKVNNIFRTMPAGSDFTVKPEAVTDQEWRLYNITAGEITNEATDRAMALMTVRRSNEGAVYVEPNAIEPVFPYAVLRAAEAPAEKLWQAQLHLWVSGDIFAAVKKTNDQSIIKGETRLDPIVPNVAVKQLVSATVDSQYTTGSSGERNQPASSLVASLTQRASSRDYEILGYSFTVVMNTSYLPALMENLLSRGDHSILSVDIVSVAVDENDRRYFGVEPVSQVTIKGEVLFWADWTRGKLEQSPAGETGRTTRTTGTATEMQWANLPLMPVEVLTRQLSGVLRDVDEKRLKQAGVSVESGGGRGGYINTFND